MGEKDESETRDSGQRPCMPLENEDALIRCCQQSRPGAFETLYHRYEEPMLSLAYRMLGSREAAEDALQDAFLKLYRRIGQFRFDAAFSTWFYRIVANVCYDRLRRRRRVEPVALDAVGDIPTVDDAGVRVHLKSAIDGLPPKMKACFVLYAQEGFTQREIAGMLGMREGTVKAHVFRAKERLREVLAPRLRGWDSNDMS